MKRVLKNWITTLLATLLFIFSGVAFWYEKMTFLQLMGALPVSFILFYAKDSWFTKELFARLIPTSK